MPRPPTRRRVLPGLALLLGLKLALGIGLAGGAAPAAAQGVELSALQLLRQDGDLNLEFVVRHTLPRTVEDALHRGVPVYFVAEATLYRSRWYWRDERVARVRRNWRIAYQPLTGSWRVGLGALSQSAGSLAEALTIAGAAGHWKLVDLAQIDADARHYVEFSYQLDTTQLPSPMQIGLGGQGDWVMRTERRLNLE